MLEEWVDYKRKYKEKLLNVENEWDGVVGCPEVMWLFVSFLKRTLQ